VESLTSTGMPLGLFPEEQHGTEERVLDPADTLIIFTDGITEAANHGEEEYGSERLVDVCRRHRHLPVPELAAAIKEDLDAFVENVPFEDDRTIVILRRLPEE
jgi:sigma-B regulation protein RsbU (phosphoserine phosphatase)